MVRCLCQNNIIIIKILKATVTKFYLRNDYEPPLKANSYDFTIKTKLPKQKT